MTGLPDKNELTRVTTHRSADGFLDAAGAWLEIDEVMNNLMLGLAGNIVAGRQTMKAPAMMLTVSAPGGPRAALLMTTPPRTAVLYAPGGGAIEALVEAMATCGHLPWGCVGPAAAAAEFALRWRERTGRSTTLKMSQRIYKLREVNPPKDVPGRLRPATMDDLDLAAHWGTRFRREAVGEAAPDPAAIRDMAERTIASGNLYLWEQNGQPLSQAVATRPTRRGICIGAVYTPPAHRRRGYASACVAALSQLQLDSGREWCALYADVANPTSNSIYRKLGYVPVGDSSQFAFEKPEFARH